MMTLRTLLIILILSFNQNIFACSILSLKSGNETLTGRNFDYMKEGGQICFFKSGAAKFAHFTINQYGKSLPYEGVNEFGLFAGINEIPSTRSSAQFSVFRKSTTSLGVVKKVLEHSRTVPEAIEKFGEYNVVFGKFLGFPMLHYLISDKNGDSAIIEFVDGKMNVIRKGNQKYQLMTNFLVAEFPPTEAVKEKLFYRYRLAAAQLAQATLLDIGAVRKVVQTISQDVDIMPGIKLIFDEGRKYSFDEIQKIFLINQAMPPEIMEIFDKNASYSAEEIGRQIADSIAAHGATASHTIWSAIYEVGQDGIKVEMYYKMDWTHPRRIDLSERMREINKSTDCVEIESLFE